MARRVSRRASRRARGVGLAAALLLVAASVACDREASQPPDPALAKVGPGQVLYLTYCEACHGAEGRGDGRVAGSLRTAPPDLTRLWERYGVPLDRRRVADYIDGRWLLRAHGPREMPIWGEELFGDAPSTTPGVEDLRRRLIEVLVDYLQTLQGEQQV